MSGYNRQPVIPVIMVAGGVVLILGAIFWSMNIGRISSANGAPVRSPVAVLNTPRPPASGGLQPQATLRIPYPEVTRIPLADAKAAYDSKSAVFLDVRGEPYYTETHIPGAISMTDAEVLSRLNELDPKQWIITYCT